MSRLRPFFSAYLFGTNRMKSVSILKFSFSSGGTTGIYMQPGSKGKICINQAYYGVSNLVHDLLSFYSCLSLNDYVASFIHYLTHDRFFQGISVVIYFH